VSLIAFGFLAFFYRKSAIENAGKYGYDESYTGTWLNVICYTSWILAAVYCLVMACNFNSLRVSIAIIDTAADFFADTKRIVLAPLCYFVVCILIFFGWLYGLACVASMGEITVSSVALQTKDVVRTDAASYMLWLMIFGMVWIVAFIIAANEFIVICASCSWYFSRKDIPDDDGIPGDANVSMGFWWSYRYHMGTLAFGSLVLTIVWFIRGIFEYLGEKMNKASGNNGCTKCLVCSIRCCLDCFDRFVRFLNMNAYIYCAISSESFCPSALHSFLLILKNAAKFGFVTGIGGVFMFLAKFCIAIFTTLVSYFLYLVMMKGEDNSPWVPCFLIFGISYIIASTFISVFDISANTILQCYLVDVDIMRQKNLDPTHVPEKLQKFLDDYVLKLGSVTDTKKKQLNANLLA
jgi:solute carrier family 44 (choline transporter-like protein), member 2/4/5